VVAIEPPHLQSNSLQLGRLFLTFFNPPIGLL
jgi:hypothetical protein